jgi:hypothetical protein
VSPGNNPDSVAFRAPFTLKLHVDKTHFYEQHFGEIPFVHEGDVYLFKGDDFGIDLVIRKSAVAAVKYQPATEKADVKFKFSQEIQPDGSSTMTLLIRNATTHTLYFDALMTTPGNQGIAKTSILPVRPGLDSYESWPHPVVQLVLRHIRAEP